MSDELAPMSNVAPGALIPNLAPANSGDLFNSIASGGSFLPRLQLFGGNSDKAKEGKVPIGHYGVVKGKDELIVLGPEVDALPISWRALAMDTRADPIASSFDRQSELFKAIESRSLNEKDSGCIFGPEFLIWLPGLKEFATFMLGSKSFRREAPVLLGLLAKPVTIKAKLVSTERFKWHVPIFTICSTPFDIPSADDLHTTAHTFNNPPISTAPQVVVETTESDRVV